MFVEGTNDSVNVGHEELSSGKIQGGNFSFPFPLCGSLGRAPGAAQTLETLG